MLVLGSTPPMRLNVSTPPLGAHATTPLEALDATPPSTLPQSLQGSNPRSQETFASEDDQNVSDVQSTSDKPVLTIDGYK